MSGPSFVTLRIARIGKNIGALNPGELRAMSLNTVSSDESMALLAFNEGRTYGVGHCPQEHASASAESRESIQQVIHLLEAAVRQLECSESAHGTLAQAASRLRKEIALHARKSRGYARSRLLAWQVQKVLAYLDSHITDRVLVTDLSALARCGEAHFSRLFKRTFGETPHAFVVKRRVELAVRRMRDPEISLTDVALSCGFSDQSHLTKCFRQLMHETPSAWRRSQSTE
jgi:AraC family transcriptional regulator